jgi:cell division protease FtsH
MPLAPGARIMQGMRRPLVRLRLFGDRAAALVRRRRRSSIAVVVILAVLTAGGSILVVGQSAPPAATAPSSGEPGFTYSGTWSLLDLQRHVQAGGVAAITVAEATDEGSAGHLLAKTSDGQLIRVSLAVDAGRAVSALSALGHGGLMTQEAWDAARAAQAPPAARVDPLRAALTWLIPLGLIIFLVLFLRRMIGRSGGGGRRDRRPAFTTIMPALAGDVGRGGSSATFTSSSSLSVRLADVAGCDEAKLELTEAIDFLRAPLRFRRLGARIPRGVLLYGPPGTGKTMLARAVAAEAGVPFIAASAAEFVEKYVGVGASRVRELFGQARSHERAVIFIDEFDAIAKARGGANSHEEREQTLNQLLIELDGFGSAEEIVVIGATNRIDTLDPAVLRPGRFNRKIHVGLPDVEGRREILAVHAAGKPLAEDVDLDGLARKTYGFSGAQLADLLNEAAILAARRGGETLGAQDVHGGWLKVAVGTSRRRSMDERERSIIAAHEIGHAICGRLHGDHRKVEEISLFAHGEALGVTVSSQEDNDLPAESDLRARLVSLMGGRAAEELLFQEVTGGAANDFEQANRIAHAMVTRWGMGRDPDAQDDGISGRGVLSFIVARPGGSLPSDLQGAATRATRAILDEAYAEAMRTLVANIDLLRRLAAYLVEHERVDGETFDDLVEGRIEVPNALEEWRPAAARPRAWTEIPDYHDGRRARPTLVRPAGQGPAPAPVPAPAVGGVPVATGTAGRRVAASPVSSSVARPATRAIVGRRLRRVAAGYLGQAQTWLRAGEGQPEV